MELPIREIYDDSDEDVEEDEIENLEPFDPTKIRIKTKMMSIDILLKRIQHDEIDLAPDFQRHADIWNDKNKSRLIESVLIGIPLPAFYVDATTDDKWLVIDGIQRINTFKKFILDQELRLTDLQFLRDLEHKKYDELSRHHQRRIEETELIVCLVESGTPPEVKYNIFRFLRLFYGELIEKCQCNKLRRRKLLKLRNPYPSRLINLSLLLIPSTIPLVVLPSK